MTITAVIVDVREPAWARALTFGNVPTAVAPLDAGDLVATTDDDALLVVARRAPTELLQGMRDNLLFPVAEAMRKQSPWSYLVITGHLAPGPDHQVLVNGVDTKWTWGAVSGALLTVQELGVHILQIPSDRHYEHTIVRLGNRDRSPVIIMPQRQAHVFADAELILAALPGVGSTRVKALLDHCGTPAYALEWLSDDECQNDAIPGIALETKRRARHALGLDDGRILAVVTRNEPVPPAMTARPGDVPVTAEFAI